MKFQKPAPPQAGIPLAPMIDVVFLLLIFFIVTWKFSRDEVDLNVAVPTAEQGENDKRPLGEIIINVREAGIVTVEGQTLTDLELRDKLASVSKTYQDEKTGKSRQPVRIRGAANVEYQRIVEVIDLCQKAGIWNISFSTRKLK